MKSSLPTCTAGVPPARGAAAYSTQSSLVQRLARKAVFKRLNTLRDGCIELVEGAQRTRFGSDQQSSPSAMVVLDPRLYTRVAFGGALGAAESYMAGEWECENLSELIRVFIRNSETLSQIQSGLARMARPFLRAGHWLRDNSPRGSRRNIAAHYDLSNDFFALFLDETLMYSSAYFERPDMPLPEASAAKNERLCQMLRLSPGDHLLEIGTGWGGFAIHAAQHHGCRVTTTTISKAQHDLAKERIEKAGLSGKITLLLEDYRALQGRFDKVVSIEMIEAVGAKWLDTFFARCNALLKPNGAMALQAITIPDQRFEHHAREVDFIKKYIFPGSCLPSVARILESTRKCTDFNLARLEDITPHYARTLRLWRERFCEKLDLVGNMGFGERFIRLWNYYLSYCEAGFAERYIGTVQMLLAKPGWRNDHLSFGRCYL
ncbi:MAG TPA: cyclopropane-fatty-acyl-phospholipid synthase family protein [Planctomycetota bacterium]|nr:cyclopropane-fatty-acyl-phospholipid synthase family protein [Planctomycetota bacterium]